MDILQSIQDAENKADGVIKKAKKEASVIISRAHEKEEEEIYNLKKELEEDELKKTAEQKISLAKLYKEIIKGGKKEEAEIKEKGRNSKKKAVGFILDNI